MAVSVRNSGQSNRLLRQTETVALSYGIIALRLRVLPVANLCLSQEPVGTALILENPIYRPYSGTARASRKVIPLTGPSRSPVKSYVFSELRAAADCGRSGHTASRKNRTILSQIGTHRDHALRSARQRGARNRIILVRRPPIEAKAPHESGERR